METPRVGQIVRHHTAFGTTRIAVIVEIISEKVVRTEGETGRRDITLVSDIISEAKNAERMELMQAMIERDLDA